MIHVFRGLVAFCFIASTCSFIFPTLKHCNKDKLVSMNIAGDTIARKDILHDIWIVGTGTLGGYILNELSNHEFPVLRSHSDSHRLNIVAETQSSLRQKDIESKGAQFRLREQRTVDDEGSARTVIICIPPSSSSDYAEEVDTAIRLWAGPSKGGNLVFTSSICVYGECPGCIVTESSDVDTSSLRSKELIAAEERVLDKGGRVVRLAGLYEAQRGPHAYWLNRAKEMSPASTGTTVSTAPATDANTRIIRGSADGRLNMLHYEDAARIVLTLANNIDDLPSRIFLACDNDWISREEMCRAALASGLFPGSPMPEFALKTGIQSKRCDNSLTRKLLHWQPKHTSFRVYMRRLGGETLSDMPPSASAAIP